jgi:hypothetical protein
MTLTDWLLLGGGWLGFLIIIVWTAVWTDRL